MNRKNRNKIVPPDFMTYGEAGGKKKNPQSTTKPPAHSANTMRQWNMENQK